MGALSQLLAALLIVTGVSGCTLLDLLLGGPSLEPDFSFPPFPAASGGPTFTSGRATIVIGDETMVLDELAGGSAGLDELGTRVAWENEDGWYLTFFSYTDPGGLPSSSTISMDRIFDHEHWVLLDPARCITTIEDGDSTAVVGTAVCRGLRWADYFTAYSGIGLPQPLEGVPPFDADITFEAH